MFQHTSLDWLLLLMPEWRDHNDVDGLNEWRGQRAIGVVCHPEYERGNYVPTRRPDRYDAHVHIDRTKAVRPLAPEPSWQGPLELDTYPTGY